MKFDSRRVSSLGGSNSFWAVLLEPLGLDSAHVVRSCLWVRRYSLEVESWPRSVEKITDRSSALYVIDVLESRDRDGPRDSSVCLDYLEERLGMITVQAVVSTGLLGMRSTSTATLARAALRV